MDIVIPFRPTRPIATRRRAQAGWRLEVGAPLGDLTSTREAPSQRMLLSTDLPDRPRAPNGHPPSFDLYSGEPEFKRNRKSARRCQGKVLVAPRRLRKSRLENEED